MAILKFPKHLSQHRNRIKVNVYRINRIPVHRHYNIDIIFYSHVMVIEADTWADKQLRLVTIPIYNVEKNLLLFSNKDKNNTQVQLWAWAK